MTDALAAARDLLTMIPVKVRKTIYGLLGLAVLVDSFTNLLPDDVGNGLVIAFGLASSVLALGNATDPLPPPPPPVPPAFDGEFA